MTTIALVTPQLSINGTCRQDLIRQQLDVLAALGKAYDAMEQAAPHGRDYQHRPEEYQQARHAWQARMRMVEELRQELYRYASTINDA